MAKCFLLDSPAYSHLREPLKRLLEVLGFDVVVLNNIETTARPESAVEEMIKNVQAVVVLYGPSNKINEGIPLVEGAQLSAFETAFIHYEKKHLALIVHSNIQLPELFQDPQAFPHFDFWDTNSFIENIHQVVKYLLDLKRRVEMPWGPQPYIFTKAIQRNRISRSGASTLIDVYSELIARQICDVFEHAIDTGGDETIEAALGLLSPDSYELEAVTGGNFHKVSLIPKANTEYEFSYFIKVEPQLQPGEVFGYRRSFEVPNRFPLSREDLIKRAQKGGYPSVFPHDFYGDFFEVLYDIETVTIAIHFPRRVKLDGYRPLAIHSRTLTENRNETDRCKKYIQLKEDPGDSQRILELTIPRPSINHSYYLLYKPGD